MHFIESFIFHTSKNSKMITILPSKLIIVTFDIHEKIHTKSKGEDDSLHFEHNRLHTQWNSLQIVMFPMLLKTITKKQIIVVGCNEKEKIVQCRETLVTMGTTTIITNGSQEPFPIWDEQIDRQTMLHRRRLIYRFPLTHIRVRIVAQCADDATFERYDRRKLFS